MTILRQSLLPPMALRIWYAALLVLVLASPSQAGSTRAGREHAIKAAAFYNILAFTGWPDTAFETPDSPLIVGVLGRGEITVLLEELLGSETWRGRPVTLRRVATPADARSCHVLYVAASERSRWRAVNSRIAGLPILTVGDAPDFARLGGTVEFAVQRNELKLIVNLGVARACGITISSKVLRLADVIGEQGS